MFSYDILGKGARNSFRRFQFVSPRRINPLPITTARAEHVLVRLPVFRSRRAQLLGVAH